MADDQYEGQEKSFEASQSKKRKARAKGDVVNSTEVTTAATYLGLTLAILMLSGSIASRLVETLTAFLVIPEEFGQQFLFSSDGAVFAQLLSEVFIIVTPLIAIPAALVLVALFAQQAVVFAPSKIKPKLSKISPIANAKQKYGPGGMGEFAKSLAKLLAISGIITFFMWQTYLELPQYIAFQAGILPFEMRDQALLLLLCMVVFSLGLAAVDLPWKIISHQNKLRMSLKEVRDETKETEGDPLFKQARQARAREIATNTMIKDVQKADVVVVNPEHYAVALKWDRADTSVPVCIAKGVNEIALRIRTEASKHNIPIHSDPPTARSMYATIDIGDSIKPEHYAAVAAAIHFSDTVRKEL